MEIFDPTNEPLHFVSYLPSSDHAPSLGIPSSRKGHKKSRRGCFACKRRKIKCPENHPECNNCIKIRAICIYPKFRAFSHPSPVTEQDEIDGETPLFQHTVFLQSTSRKFDKMDMKLLHHFLMTAYPHLPLGNDRVWVEDIALYAQSHDFLIHAMLALSAGHLIMTTSSPEIYRATALSHRIQAIQGLNVALSSPPKTAMEADMIIATCFALAMQTSYLGDSVTEFLTMFRGIQLVLAQNWGEKLGSRFSGLGGEGMLEVVEERLTVLPVVHREDIEQAVRSLENIRGLCGGEVEGKVWESLRQMMRELERSSRAGYFAHLNLCISLSCLPVSEFKLLIDPSNPVMQILLSHFVATFVLIYPIKRQEWKGRDMGRPNRNCVFKLEGTVANVPRRMRGFLDWPMGIRCAT